MSQDDTQLLDIAARLGYGEIPEVLSGTASAVRRGHHLALLAAEGSGHECVYALALAESCDAQADELQAIVLAPTHEGAARLAQGLHHAVAERGLRVIAPPVQASGSLELSGSPLAHCIVAKPSVLLPEIRSGHLHLAALRLLVIGDVGRLGALDEWPSVEPLLDTLGPDTRKIATSGTDEARLNELVERQLPRARRWPEELFERRQEPDGSTKGTTIQCATAADAAARLALVDEIVRCLLPRGTVRIRCVEPGSAHSVAASLASRGLTVSEAEGDTLLVRKVDAPEGRPQSHVMFGLPLSLPSLGEALAGAGEKIAVVDALHAAQLELLARRAGWTVLTLGAPPLPGELEPIARFRKRVRECVEGGGTDAELLVLEPLLREYGAVRVAAALSAMSRGVPEPAVATIAWPDAEAASLAGATHRGTRRAWSRIYIGAGRRDEVRAADLVGAITGETGVAGAQIGKIEIRGSYSLVEIESQVVDRVIRELDGISIRGRTVGVRRDRET